MRPSVIAIAILVVCGAGAYAYVNDYLPVSVSSRVDGLLADINMLRGGVPAPPAGAATTGRTQAQAGGRPPSATPVEVADAEHRMDDSHSPLLWMGTLPRP